MDVSLNIEELTDFYYYEDKVNKNQEFYWYTTNYIGFESHEELKKFFEYFDENDNTNNNLYNIRNKLYPSYISLIIGALLIIVCLAYAIYLIIILVKNASPKKLIIIIKKIIDILTTIGGIIYYVVCAHSTHRSIHIKMDKNYMEVLNLYNKRRKQIYFLSGIIIISFNLIYEIFLYFFKFKSNKELENISNSEEEEARRSSGKRSGRSRSTDDPVVYGGRNNGTPSTIRQFSNSINNDNDNDNNINNNNELSININNRNN
jgi:hypothetical protein